LATYFEFPEAEMASDPGAYARLQMQSRVEQGRGEQVLRRLRAGGNNPYAVGPEPERRTYSDPTADQAIANADRQRRQAGRE
jgi:hypothetical protein